MLKETTIMWIRQVPEVWETLKMTGVYHVKREYVERKNGSMEESPVWMFYDKNGNW